MRTATTEGPTTSAEQRADLHRLLSIVRLRGYVTPSGASRGRSGDEIALYAYNMAVAAALLGPLHVLEVVLRNAMHAALTSHAGNAAWWAEPTVLPHLKPWAVAQVASATTKVERARRRSTEPTTADDVVAATDFGFWTDLTSNTYEHTLWQDALRHSFPHTRRTRSQIYQALQSRRQLRNRISHHEPVHDRDVLLDYAHIIELIGFISPAVARWVDERSRLVEVASSQDPQRF